MQMWIFLLMASLFVGCLPRTEAVKTPWGDKLEGRKAGKISEVPGPIAPGPEHGLVRLRADPPDAEVLVNGVTQGLASDFFAPGYLKLGPGVYRIELRKIGYASFRADIVVSPEVIETFPVRLRRLPSLETDRNLLEKSPSDPEGG